MQNKKDYVFKWHRNSAYLIVGLIVSFFVELTLLISLFQEEEKTPMALKPALLIIFIAILIIDIVVFIYSFNYGWNRAIYFDHEKVWQKIKGKIYEWRWEDMTDVELYACYKGFVMVKITTDTDYKKLSLSFSGYRYKKIMKFCPNEKFKELLKKKYE